MNKLFLTFTLRDVGRIKSEELQNHYYYITAGHLWAAEVISYSLQQHVYLDNKIKTFYRQSKTELNNKPIKRLKNKELNLLPTTHCFIYFFAVLHELDNNFITGCGRRERERLPASFFMNSETRSCSSQSPEAEKVIKPCENPAINCLFKLVSGWNYLWSALKASTMD